MKDSMDSSIEQLNELLNKPRVPQHSNQKTPKTGTKIYLQLLCLQQISTINSNHDIISLCMQSQQYLLHIYDMAYAL